MADDTSNDITFDYSYYFTYAVNNQFGVQSLSGYALDNSPMIFVPTVGAVDELQGFSNKRIVWDYGDGTRQEAITGTHVYKTPGTYKIKSYLYDKLGNGYYNTFSVTVNIYDFIEDKLELQLDNAVVHNAGEIKNPISIIQYNSARTIEKNGGMAPVKLYADSKDRVVNFDLFETKNSEKTYGHLLPSHTFIKRIEGVENIAIDVLRPDVNDAVPIYAKVGGTGLIATLDPTDAVFAGVSSVNDVYFRSDIPGEYDLVMGFEEGTIFNYTNTTSYGTKAQINENLVFDDLSVTSNGIDGEDILSFDRFDINPVKFACSKISFVSRMKDDENFSHKYVPIIDFCPLTNSGHLPLTAVLTDGTTVYEDAEFFSDFGSVSADLTPADFVRPGEFDGYYGGFFKGYMIIDTDVVLNDVWIETYTTYKGIPLSGQSSKFSIYPDEYYQVAKKGEDIDFTDAIKDMALQPLFTDSKILMNDFFGAIFGSIESAQDSIGKSTYEKIENFLDNNSVIDYANIDQLASILQLFELPSINKFSLPPKVKRLMDLLSISQSRLFGDINQNRENFSSFGYLNTDTYGFDRCDPIPADGAIFVYGGFDIVAFEKYSGKWLTLNTMLPLCASNPPVMKNLVQEPNPIGQATAFGCLVGDLSCTPIFTESLTAINVENDYFHVCIESSFTYDDRLLLTTEYYTLSDYNKSWGWPLTLDKDGSLFDVYDFFYKKRYEITDVENSVINFDDSNTTIDTNYTYSEWTKQDGVMSNIFANALYDGLGLIDCTETLILSAAVTKSVVSIGDIDQFTYTIGEPIRYRVEIQNPNDVGLNSVRLIESLPGAPGSLFNITGNTELLKGQGYISPGETLYIEYDYTTSESDVYDQDQVDPNTNTYVLSNIAAFTSSDLRCPAESNQVLLDIYIPPKDLIVTKAVNAESYPFKVGKPITYTVSIENQNLGTVAATMVDSLPGAPASLTNITGAAGLLTPGGAILDGDSTTTISYDYTPTVSDIGNLPNIATVSSALPDAVSNEVIVGIPGLDDLVVNKSVTSGAGPYFAGDIVTYYVTITNTNFIDAETVTLVDSLPGITATDGDTDLLTTGVDISAGSTTNITYTYTVTPADDPGGIPSIITNTATAQSTNIGSGADSVDVPVGVIVEPLQVVKVVTSGNGPYLAGDTVSYSVEILNPNMIQANGVTLVDSLPGITATGGDTDLLTTGVNVPAGEIVGVTYDYVLTVTDDPGGPATLTNTATATTTNNIPSGSDSATVSVGVALEPLVISKNITTPLPVEVNSPVGYSVLVANPNPYTVTNVVITDSLSPLQSEGGSIDLFTGTTIGPNASKTVTYEYVPTTSGTLTNSVVVTSDDVAGDSSATASASVYTPGQLVVSKSLPSGAGPYEVGDDILYRVSVQNPNPVTVTGVSLDDDLTPITYVGGSNDLLTGSVDIAPQQTVSVDYKFNVVQGDANSTIINTATVSSDDFDDVVVSATVLIDENRWAYQTDNFGVSEISPWDQSFGDIN